jgi:hypothetical protein
MEVDTNELLHRIGAVLRVISNKMDQLIEIVERAGGEVWFPSEEESKTFADILMDDACIPSDAVADEPPKKWRILEPGEVVCSSDWVTAKTSPPSDPPNGLGWRPVDASVGTSVCQDDPCIFARLVADEPAKKAEPEHPPDPGEGYRILSKNPPEDLSPGDEYFGMWDGLWRESRDASEGIREQRETRWYRRKIEPAKQPDPAWEPKVGGWVLVTRPENWVKCSSPWWNESMHRFDGQVGQIEREREGHFQIRGFVASKECSYIFHRDWLSPAKPPEPVEPIRSWVPEGYSLVEMALPDVMAQAIGEGNALVWKKPVIGERFCGEEGTETSTRDYSHYYYPVLVPTRPPAVQYREPTQADVGRMVEVRDVEEESWESRELLAVLPQHIKYRIAVDSGEGLAMLWRFARIKKDA